MAFEGQGMLQQEQIHTIRNVIGINFAQRKLCHSLDGTLPSSLGARKVVNSGPRFPMTTLHRSFWITLRDRCRFLVLKARSYASVHGRSRKIQLKQY